eukprot:766676-Hanusia_phi.AAC.1
MQPHISLDQEPIALTRSPGGVHEKRSSMECRQLRLFCAVPMLLVCSMVATLLVIYGGSDGDNGLSDQSELLSGIDGYLINKYGDDEDALKAYGLISRSVQHQRTARTTEVRRKQAPELEPGENAKPRHYNP